VAGEQWRTGEESQRITNAARSAHKTSSSPRAAASRNPAAANALAAITALLLLFIRALRVRLAHNA